jgi:MCP family monocarboxylic acid transporter-like MFS transporter 13/MCP family monocarboxylic acid transporter-like MFS transporter 12
MAAPALDGGLAGWGKVGSMMVVQASTIGLQYAFGILFVVLLEAFPGHGRAAVSWVGALSTGVLEIAAVLAGVVSSATSARFCVFIGVLLTWSGLFLSSFATELWHLYITFGVLVGLGHALCFPAGMIVVNGWFTKRRALANGVGTTGVGIGTLIFGPITKMLVDAMGWRATFRVLSLSAASAMLAGLNYTSRVEAEQGCGMRWLTHPCEQVARTAAANTLKGTDSTPGAPSAPSGEVASAQAASTADTCGASVVVQMLRMPKMRRFVLGQFIWGWGFWIAPIHAPRFAQDLGHPASVVATLVSCIGLGSLCGRIPITALADALGRTRVYIGVLCVYGTATAALCLATEETMLGLWMVYAVVAGACCGSLMALTGPVAVEALGVQDPKLVMIASTAAFSCMGTGVMFGPPIAGLLFDHRGDYFLSFALASLVILMGAVVLMTPERLWVAAEAASPKP